MHMVNDIETNNVCTKRLNWKTREKRLIVWNPPPAGDHRRIPLFLLRVRKGRGAYRTMTLRQHVTSSSTHCWENP